MSYCYATVGLLETGGTISFRCNLVFLASYSHSILVQEFLLSSTWMCGGLFLYGNSSLWFLCGDRTPHKGSPVLWPQQHRLGGLGAWRLKYVFNALSSPIKHTYMHVYVKTHHYPFLAYKRTKKRQTSTNTSSFYIFRRHHPL